MRTQILTGFASSAILLGSCAPAQGALPRTPEAAVAGTPVVRNATPDLDLTGNYREGADARLVEILRCAAGRHADFRVRAVSGLRPGDRRFHGRGMAVDVVLVDAISGRSLPNYQSAESFRAYERFAQTARNCQTERYQELDNAFRWGGYFSGGSRKYGALDLMHFDIGGNRIPMGGGTWAEGLSFRQRNLWPDALSIGMNSKTAERKQSATQGVSSL